MSQNWKLHTMRLPQHLSLCHLQSRVLRWLLWLLFSLSCKLQHMRVSRHLSKLSTRFHSASQLQSGSLLEMRVALCDLYGIYNILYILLSWLHDEVVEMHWQQIRYSQLHSCHIVKRDWYLRSYQPDHSRPSPLGESEQYKCDSSGLHLDKYWGRYCHFRLCSGQRPKCTI